MNVLHVISGDVFGGAEQMLSDLCAAQIRIRGYNVRALLFNSGRLASELSKFVDVTILDESATGWLGLQRCSRRLIRGSSLNIVHTHRTKETIIAGSAALLSGVPRIRTVHGSPEHQVSVRSIPRLTAQFAERLLCSLGRQKSVVVSDRTPNFGKLPTANSGVSIIENGIDLRRISSSTRNIEPTPGGDPFRLAMFARLVPVKRIDVAISALEQLKLRYGVDAQLNVFGEGPLRERLEKIASGSAVANLIKFHGDTTDVPSQMARMQGVLVSSESEGWPICVLEAMAASVPVIATPVGGIPKMLGSGSGYISTSTCPEDLAAAMFTCISDPERRSKAKNAMERVAKFWSSDRMAERYDVIYREVCGTSRASGLDR